MPTEMVPIVAVILAAVALLGLAAAAFHPNFRNDAGRQRRLATVGSPRAAGAQTARVEDPNRRDIELTLREMEEKQKALKGSKPSLLVRMRQAGLGWSPALYYGYCALAGGGTFLVMLGASGIGLLPALGFGIATGLLGPHFYVSFRRSRRFKTFAKGFPNAIDVIVRGVKSGLPAVDCLRIISLEAQEPVRGEFKEVIEDQTLGLPLDQAVQRLPARIPLAEAKFFAIVISLQSRTGGNLSDALASLSKVLRERQKMQAKVRAVSAEAKTSAGIIGSMPIAVIALMHLSNPKYIDLLFTKFSGNVVLAGCALSMLIGSLVMWKMIRFDF